MIKSGKRRILLAALLSACIGLSGCGGAVSESTAVSSESIDADAKEMLQDAKEEVLATSPEKVNKVTELLTTSEDKKKEKDDLAEARRQQEAALQEQVKNKLESMTLEDKVAQMFVVTPDGLTDMTNVLAAGPVAQRRLNQIPVGGICVTEQNLAGADKLKEMLNNLQIFHNERIGVPMFTFVAEEGGAYTKIAGTSGFPEIGALPVMSEIGASGDAAQAKAVGQQIGTYLSELGINFDLAPCADVLVDPSNTSMAQRSFGSDPAVVSEMAISEMQGLEEQHVQAVFTHFPGMGSAAENPEAGTVLCQRTREELMENEVVPYRNAIPNGLYCIMVSNVSYPQVTGDEMPASLSSGIITDMLRTDLGYDGIVMTDALNMKAVTDHYTSAEAVVMAVKAGADMVQRPTDLSEAYQTLLKAVRNGEIEESRIDESVKRILRAKYAMQNAGISAPVMSN
uniref:beta-N-acetylhexosaminidase n=1 Tax=Eubacterium cellulosolvens (strain ATCC 43171 / JCM 9499 / 6) TaxID=633697 RepID=I5ASR1_EUBC6